MSLLAVQDDDMISLTTLKNNKDPKCFSFRSRSLHTTHYTNRYYTSPKYRERICGGALNNMPNIVRRKGTRETSRIKDEIIHE